MPAFIQSYSQSQAKLMFVTTLGMDDFDCTKMNAHLKKFIACLREGLIHKWKQVFIHLSPLCRQTTHSSVPHTTTFWILKRSANDTLHILVKAQPSTRSTWPRSPTRLGIQPRDLGLLNKYSLGHCGISAASI